MKICKNMYRIFQFFKYIYANTNVSGNVGRQLAVQAVFGAKLDNL